MKQSGDWPLMRGERRVRFGCGALAGLAAGLVLAERMNGSVVGNVLLVVVTAVAFGIAAAWIGDEFWNYIRWW
jgi:hypothetical protein